MQWIQGTWFYEGIRTWIGKKQWGRNGKEIWNRICKRIRKRFWNRPRNGFQRFFRERLRKRYRYGISPSVLFPG